MNIVIYTPFYLPRIGGIELKAEGLAGIISSAGHHVTLITRTPKQEPDKCNFVVHRNKSIWSSLKNFASADVIVYMNVSLIGIIPLLFYKQPFIIAHDNVYYSNNNKLSIKGRLKYFIARFAHANLCCSAYVAQFIKHKAIVTGNPYRNSIYTSIRNHKDRPKDLVFLGRLVSDKGCHILLQALSILKSVYNKTFSLTIIGDGEDRIVLETLAYNLGIANQINFVGFLMDLPLRDELNLHKVMVVPSVWQEPFGIVALEGLACGCKLIVPDCGGLPEAVGNFGTIFKSADPADLARTIIWTLLQDDYNGEELQQHLKKFTLESVASYFLTAINSINERNL